MKKSQLINYAKLATKIGLNIQPNQEVDIIVSPDQAEFAKYLTIEAYRLKAKRVRVRYTDDNITKLHYKYQKQKALNEFTSLDKAELERKKEVLPCMIYVEDSDPNAFNGIKTEKINAARQAKYPFQKPYIDYLDNRYQWVIIAMPSFGWSKKVFPELGKREGFKKLEEAILSCTRLDQVDPVKAWEDHINKLKSQAKFMNNHHFESLTYSSSNGTDITVGLHPKHVWLSAREDTLQGISFSANMPTEEVFTMPDKYNVNGIVYSTKPLSYQGNLIEDFSVEFKDGKAVKVNAKVGQKYLEEMINMDEGSAYLGEVALVPFNSPINETNIMFYNTLFDENACCHLALGMAFKNNLEGYENMNEEDFKNENYNDSMNHVDFMIGTKDLKIVGNKGNQKTVVFENGVWAF
ncbi:MAG: aminopeptidase [Erysipelotrichaceae bacterium]